MSELPAGWSLVSSQAGAGQDALHCHARGGCQMIFGHGKTAKRPTVWLAATSPARTEEPQAPWFAASGEGVVRQDRAQGDRDHEDEWEPVRHLTHLTGRLRSTVCAAMNAAKPVASVKSVLAVISELGKTGRTLL
jgi:hypothetical protein